MRYCFTQKVSFTLDLMYMGKILGFILGFYLTRTLFGGIVGAFAGHIFFDLAGKRARSKGRGPRMHFGGFQFGSSAMFHRQDLFYKSFFTLLGKIASSDGSVSEVERRYFQSLLDNMKLHGQMREMAERYFSESAQNPQTYQDIARQFYDATTAQPQLRSQLLYQLVGLASADKFIAKDERELLEKVAEIFGVSDTQLDHMCRSFDASDSKSYHVLGVTPDSSDEEIKKAYRTMIKEYHPDILKSKGLPASMLEFAEQRFHEIQSAWEQIKKERNIKD